MKLSALTFLTAILFLSACGDKDDFSCNGKGQFRINSDRFCATGVNVLRRNEWVTGESVELGISATGLNLRLSAESRGSLLEENKEYAYVHGGTYPFAPAYFTILESAGINTVSVWVTFSKIDRTNKLLSGTFRATWLDYDGNGKPVGYEGDGSFTDISFQ